MIICLNFEWVRADEAFVEFKLICVRVKQSVLGVWWAALQQFCDLGEIVDMVL